jgi:hypothetical protein
VSDKGVEPLRAASPDAEVGGVVDSTVASGVGRPPVLSEGRGVLGRAELAGDGVRAEVLVLGDFRSEDEAALRNVD